MKIRSNWREILASLVEGKSWAAISRASKLNATYLRDVLEKGQTPQLISAEKLSNGLGMSVTDWFLEASTPGTTPQETQIRPDLMPRDMPVYGNAAGAEDGAFEFNTGEPMDYVRRPPRLDNIRNAYAIYISGKSVSPWREEGQLAYVHPTQPPKIGDYVVAQISPDKPGDAPKAYVKRLQKRTSREIVLEQFNPPKTLSFPLNRVVSLHRVMDWSELLGL